MTDKVAEADDDEHDPYLEHLAKLGRSEDDDLRISIHESGHAIAARLLGHPLGGATVDPDPNGRWGGLVWGPCHSVAFSEGDDADDLPEICEKLRTLMPQDGEPRGDAANIYLHALNRCIELAAASVAERMLLPGEPVPSVSDEQAVELASLCCRSAEAVERFLALAEQQAHDLIYPHVPIIMSLATVLRIQRTLTGEEIDNVIATTHARLVLAAEQARRAKWRRAVENAAQFKSEPLRR